MNDTQQPSTSFQWEEDAPPRTSIKVVGVGGGGSNAVDDMIDQGFEGVEFYAINTDFKALELSKAPNKVQIGMDETHGLGCGAIPDLGEKAARSSEQQIQAMLEGADMVFITAGMGGGTGTGAAPVVAEMSRAMGILNVAVVTRPFSFEGMQRMRNADRGIRALYQHVDTGIVVLNDKLKETVGSKTPLTEAFRHANSVLAQAIRAISDLVSKPGLIHVDFRDVRTIMGETGGAVMGVGVGKGENRASEAVKKACQSPLQEKIVIDGARGVLINITGGEDLSLQEIDDAMSTIYEAADQDANIIFGVVIDKSMTEEMRVTIIATGFHDLPDTAPGLTPEAGGPVRPRVVGEAPLPKPGDGVSVPNEFEPENAPTVAAVPASLATSTPPTAPATPAPAPPVRRDVDFDRSDNPLNQWEGKSFTVETDGHAATPAPSPAQPPTQPAAPLPREGENISGIPAIERRRNRTGPFGE